jgi:HK97 family phage major capsid protein
MPMTVKQLQEERAPIGAEIRKMADKVNDEKRDFTAEERSAWDKANEDFNRLSKQIDVARRAEEVDGELNKRRTDPPGREDTQFDDPTASNKKRGKMADEARAIAFQGWARRQLGHNLTPQQRAACKAVGLNPGQRTITLSLPRRPGQVEQRALSAVTNTAGQYTIPQGFVNNLEVALKAYNGMRAGGADVIRTESGNTLPWPTATDVGNTGELISENTGVASADPTFGVASFGAYKFSSKLVLVPNELLEDSAFNLGEEIFAMLGERLGRSQETYFTTGTGTSQPQGAITGATLGKTAASPTAIAADEIVDLIHSIDPAYRTDPSMRLMMHDLVFAVIRKLKDGQGRYLFEEGNNGAPDRIKGVQIAINMNMASTVATGNKTILAGPMKKFKIRDVNQIRMRRLEERYGELDQVGFVAFMRSDSKVLDAGTHPLKYYQQA